MNDEFYIRRCIELAKKATGYTWPNPLVGSVIVYKHTIIGEGYHRKAGDFHAEINAIQSVKNPELLKDSTIYVSLEPCAHYGRTPPCADRIIETGFKRVVIGAMDIHEKVNGKGKKMIQDAGIEVTSGILADECRELNKRFFTYHQKKRPYIILKWAESADGFLDRDFLPTRISNSLINQFTHQLRADEHAILVGATTAVRDNPSLTVRHVTGKNPVRILLDPHLKVPRDCRIYDDEAPGIVFNLHEDAEVGTVKLIKITGENLLEQVLTVLYQLEIQSVIVEGGSYTLQQFIDADLWDEAVVIRNTDLFLGNGTKAPNLVGTPNHSEVYRDNFIQFYRK